MGNIKSKFIIGVVAALAGSFFFSHTAYAASYINVSSGSGGTVSFGSIKPTSTGTSAAASDTLTVHTDCSVGYSVYVSGQNGKDTNLTNKSAESDNIISTSSNAIGSAGSLNSNTWGLNYENTGTYVGLPTYADATNTALTTKTSVDEESTVPIYYGIKVDTSITPGTYTGDVLYTVLMDSSCQAYTVIFNSNGGTGTMDNQSIMAGTTTALTANSFTRTNYTFLGWSKSANGKTGTATNGIGTEADVDYTDKAEVINPTSGGSSITLYAIWEQSFDTTTMQGWSQGDGCASLSASQQITLTDSRDNHSYTVKKLPDGKCWMTQNLTIGDSNSTAAQRTLTPANTNIDDGKTYYLPPAGKQGSSTIDDPSTLTATDAANFATGFDIDAHSKTQFRTKDYSIVNDSDTGYYNFYTATLGFSYSGSDVSSGSSTRDICPKGWRLPNVTDGGGTVDSNSAEFTALAKVYNTSAQWSGSPLTWPYSTKDSKIYEGIHDGVATSGNNYAGFSYTGSYEGTSLDDKLDSDGIYRTSSVYAKGNDYILHFDSSNVYPQRITYIYRGHAVRCIAQSRYTVSYSNTGASSGEPSKISEVINDGANLTFPTAGTMVRNGYEFKGWALTFYATEADYQPDNTVRVSALTTAAQTAGQTAAPGSTITLYPVWARIPDKDDMQSWNSCVSLSTGQSVYLKDARDDRVYAVKKLPDGKCWMVQNLALGMNATETGLTLTPENTNIDNGKTYYLPPAGKQGSSTIDDPSTLTATDTANFSGSDNRAKTQFRTKSSSIINDSDTGYYNFYTATLGYSYYNGGQPATGYSTRDICPKGWRLPIVKNDFTDLATSYNSTTGWNGSSTAYDYYNDNAAVKDPMYLQEASPMATSVQNNFAGFSYAGQYWGTGIQGMNRGYYWTSSSHNQVSSHQMMIDASKIYPQTTEYKTKGLAVRCVKEDRTLSDITYMQDINSGIVANTATNTYAQLTDSRDDNKYYVKKLADGKLWMVQNLRLVGSRGITSANSDVAANFTITASTATPSSSTWCTTDSSDCTDKSLVYYNASEASDSTKSSYYGALYNWYTATAGTGTYSLSTGNATSSICPKGWHLPISGYDTSINEFSILDIAWGGSGKDSYSAATYNTFIGPYADGNNGDFGLAGHISGSVYHVGSVGRYWSSTAHDSNSDYAHFITLGSNGVHPRYSGDKYRGNSVRCLAR